MSLRILAIGSIGKQGEGRLEFVVSELKSWGYEVISFGKAYGDIDWRDHYEEAQRTISEASEIEHEDFDVAVADLSAPSDGRQYQLGIIRNLGIPVYGYAPVKVSSPFWLNVDQFYRDMKDLRYALIGLETEIIKERQRVKKEEERKNRNPFYRLWGEAWTSAGMLAAVGLLLVGGGLVITPSDTGGIWIAFGGALILLFIIWITWERRRNYRKYRKQAQTAD